MAGSTASHPDLLRRAGGPALPAGAALRPSVGRLFAVSAAVAAGAGLLAGWGLLVLLLHGPRIPHAAHFVGAQLALLTLSLVMARVARSPRLAPARIVRAGMVYEPLGALTISFCAFFGDEMLQPVMLRLSWLAVWIVAFPLVVPRTPRVALLLAWLSACTAPAVFVVWSWHVGRPLPEVQVLGATFVPYFICAGLAALPAAVLEEVRALAEGAAQDLRRLGSWKLEELLGTGGMGEVWRARHELLARPVAVKLVRLRRLGPGERQEAAERFEREARATAALRSPHVVSVFDYGVSEEGDLYYAMELLDGLDLESLVTRHGPLPPGRALTLLVQACAGLGEAHAAGLVHRDVKPGNLIVCPFPPLGDFLKVVDFGLVAPLRRATGSTGEDFLVGTPAYLAPEVIEGAPADARSDLYALGCVAYWLLTGARAFEAPTAAAMVARHLTEVPRPPSLHAPGIPPALDALVLGCLAKDPARRPASAGALAEALTRVAAEVAPWSAADAARWWGEVRVAPAAAEHEADRQVEWLRGQGRPGEPTDTVPWTPPAP